MQSLFKHSLCSFLFVRCHQVYYFIIILSRLYTVFPCSTHTGSNLYVCAACITCSCSVCTLVCCTLLLFSLSLSLSLTHSLSHAFITSALSLSNTHMLIQDRSNVHKGNRGSPVSGLTQLGSSATMMPHGSYEITSSLHHHLPYGTIMRPPAIHHMTPHMGRLTNDLGPPIFMPCKYSAVGRAIDCINVSV